MKSIVCFALLCALLVSGLYTTGMALADQSATLHQGRVTVAVPDDWQPPDSYGEDGMVLCPPDPRAWPVEVVLWPIPEGGAWTADAAAAAHEAVIGRAYPYTRRDSSAFLTTEGKRGLQVVGEVRTTSGRTVTSMFIAFVADEYYCAIGTFSLPDRYERALADYLQPIARSLQLAEAGHEAPPIARPTVTDPPPAIVSPSHQPPVQPRHDPTAVVSLAVPHSAPLQVLGDDFVQLRAPADWQLDRSDGRWIVRPSGVRGHAMGVLIWPLVCDASDTTAADVARAALDQWQPSRGQSFQFRSGGEDATVSFTGIITAPAGSLQLVGTCTTDRQSALLTAIYMSPGQPDSDWRMMLETLTEVRIQPLVFARPNPKKQHHWWTPSALTELSVPIPYGWKARGQVERTADRWNISIEASDVGPKRLHVAWKQPMMPLFRELSDLLISMGYKASDRYTPEAGEAHYTLLARPQSPEQLVEKYCNGQSTLRLTDTRIVASNSLPELSGLLANGETEAAYVVVEGNSPLGPRRNHYIIAIAPATDAGPYIWQAAVLEAAAPAEDYQPALHALKSMIEDARFDEGYAADPALRKMLGAASRAVSALPVAEGSLTARELLTSPLTLLSADGTDKWELPLSALQPWHYALQDCRKGKPVRQVLQLGTEQL
jgi:hypothetical protein